MQCTQWGLLEHPLVVTTRQFLRRQPASARRGAEGCPVHLSLSGGVDSMVLCTILAAAGRTGRPPFATAAVHIDYGNRPESGAEADFVEAWCRECVSHTSSWHG